MAKRIIAAFDFDGTLIVKDSFIEFARYTLGTRRLLAGCLRALPWIAAWKLHLCSGGVAKEKLFGRLYKGITYDKFSKYGQTFASILYKIENHQTVSRLQWHKSQGHEVYIVSASAPEWIQMWASSYGIEKEHIIGTKIAINPNGHLTGRFSSPNCAGTEKVTRLRQAAGDLSEATIYAYGNSSDDLPMLNIAQYPTYLRK